MEQEDWEPEVCPNAAARRKRRTLIAIISAGIMALSLMVSIMLAGPNLKAGADQLLPANDWILIQTSEGTNNVAEYGSYSKIWNVIRDELEANDVISIMNSSGYGEVECVPQFGPETEKTFYVCNAVTVAGFDEARIKLYVSDELPDEAGGFQVHLVVSRILNSEYTEGSY